ncbi:MAG TPA: hypothetical protein VGH32_10300 [Pirellulales bacterium]
MIGALDLAGDVTGSGATLRRKHRGLSKHAFPFRIFVGDLAEIVGRINRFAAGARISGRPWVATFAFRRHAAAATVAASVAFRAVRAFARAVAVGLALGLASAFAGTFVVAARSVAALVAFAVLSGSIALAALAVVIAFVAFVRLALVWLAFLVAVSVIGLVFVVAVVVAFVWGSVRLIVGRLLLFGFLPLAFLFGFLDF